MTEQFEEMLRNTSRNIDVGYLSALFDTAIEYISKIAVDERISEPIHKAINPTLNDMVGQLYSMKNNMMATMMFEGGVKTKVVQPVKSYPCGDCANENTDVCDSCVIPNESGSRPSNWKPKDTPKDCDEGRICPKCGKVMTLCVDERFYYQTWECDGCGHMEFD